MNGPATIEPADWPVWLGEAAGPPADLLRPAATGVVCQWPVSRAINSVRNNDAGVLHRIDDPHAPPTSDAPAGATPA